MISKLVSFLFIALVSAQVPEQYPAGVDPAKCPNFPICDNAALHNSQAVPRALPLPPHHYQAQPHHSAPPPPPPPPSQPKQQWVGVEQRNSVPVSHRNTVLPSYNPVPHPQVVHSIPRPVQPPPSYPVHGPPSSHESSSQWTLKNLHFDSNDFSTNYISEPVNHQSQQPSYYEPQPQPQQHQHQYQPQPQPQQQQHRYSPPPQQHQPQQHHYAPQPNYSNEQQQKGGDRYPAGVDAKSCPNYPYCGSNGLPHPSAHQPPAPLPGFTERLYPAGVSPQECANFPYCFE